MHSGAASRAGLRANSISRGTYPVGRGATGGSGSENASVEDSPRQRFTDSPRQSDSTEGTQASMPAVSSQASMPAESSQPPTLPRRSLGSRPAGILQDSKPADSPHQSKPLEGPHGGNLADPDAGHVEFSEEKFYDAA